MSSARAKPKAGLPRRAVVKPAQMSVDFDAPLLVEEESAAESSSAPPSPLVNGANGVQGDAGARGKPGKPGKKAEQRPAGRRASAADMATKQREISVSEFFSKNRHLLGFDNPAKALLTTIKEAVDNALDACEEAGILPDVLVEVHPAGEERFRVVVEDNGPGIVRAQIPKIFARLLYGSKFHTLKQSRGQQGIGISAAGMYGLLTTGKPITIISRTGAGKPAHYFELAMDTRKNEPQILVDRTTEWTPEHGTRVEITLQATYKRGRHSVDGYLRQVAIANPHARVRYLAPDSGGTPEVFERVADQLPPEPLEIKPHPHGVELGLLLKMLQDTKARNLTGFLTLEFSRVSARVAHEIALAARLSPSMRPSTMQVAAAEKLHAGLAQVKLMAPPSNCISPIGEELLLRALQQDVRADFYATVTRPPAVYRGNPFQIEVGLAYGGDLPGDELVTLYRYANRVPLLYQQSACAITKSILAIDWKSYHLAQSKGALPNAPMVLLVHVASVWVPFTSESKEAVAHYPEIMKEIRLGLLEAGRRVSAFVSRRRRELDESKKRSYIQKYIPQIGIALQDILKLSDPQRDKACAVLTDTLERSRSGQELAEEGGE